MSFKHVYLICVVVWLVGIPACGGDEEPAERARAEGPQQSTATSPSESTKKHPSDDPKGELPSDPLAREAKGAGKSDQKGRDGDDHQSGQPVRPARKGPPVDRPKRARRRKPRPETADDRADRARRDGGSVGNRGAESAPFVTRDAATYRRCMREGRREGETREDRIARCLGFTTKELRRAQLNGCLRRAERANDGALAKRCRKRYS